MSELAIADVRESRIATRPLLTRAILDQESEQRKLLGEFVKREMIEGHDYGVIPGTKEKTLLKPGAEKLTGLFRCAPEFEIESKIEDFDKPLFHYAFRCRIVGIESGAKIAEGFGSCNSREGKYRWRTEDRKCPKCGAAAIMRSKYPPRDAPDEEPGWYCFAKKGGCGQNYSAGDETIESQTTGRVENDDIATLNNNILKVAKKRALVDASLALARCSDMFTQDMEDVDMGGPDKRPEGKKTGNFTSAPTTSTGPPRTATTGNGNDPPDKAEVDECLAAMNECRNRDELKEIAATFATVKNLTADGKAHLKAEYVRRWKELPKAVPVNEDSEPEQNSDNLPPY
jgi:hypothetical protein